MVNSDILSSGLCIHDHHSRGHCSNLLKVPNVLSAFFSQDDPVMINSKLHNLIGKVIRVLFFKTIFTRLCSLKLLKLQDSQWIILKL